MTGKRPSLRSLAERLVFDRNGPLTRELVRKPAGFGLGQVPERFTPDSTTTAVCGFCSTGCGLRVHLSKGEAVNLSAATEYPVNAGMACPKGWEALAPLRSSDRATHPMVRRTKDGPLERVSWEEALSLFVGRFSQLLEKHGPDAVAFLGTGQMPTEELALLGSLAKFGMGFVHGDGNTRQCMATAVVSYKQTFGFDAPPYTYQDFEESDVIVLIGSNLCIAHPIMWERVCKNPHSPKIIVVDPRRTETAMAATDHIPLRPKSDLVLFYGLARLLIERGRVQHDFVDAHTTGFAAFAEHVAAYTLDRVVQETGISESRLQWLANTIAEGKRVSFWWTMGVNQSHEGVLVAEAIIALALMTGNIGRPGTGANSITGQCNAMGSRLFSNTTNLLGGRSFESESDRVDVARLLRIDAGAIPDRGSLAYDQIVDGIVAGKIKGLWVVATNSAHSWIHQTELTEALKRLDFLVVQDMYSTTETAAFADLLLPAAGWGEKEGTFQILKKLSRGRPCDITGIRDYVELDRLLGVQWPLPEGSEVTPGSQRRLFEDGKFFFPDGKARFVFGEPRAMPEPVDASYPLLLLTGRGSSSQWHTQTRTAKSKTLARLYSSEPYVEINPADAERAGIASKDWVIVESRRGRMRARAFVSHIVQAGQVFVPMHYKDTNVLTFPSVDPQSRQPSYKASAVRVSKAP
jgi:assimilatory nitrate reductase catalytic subunit